MEVVTVMETEMVAKDVIRIMDKSLLRQMVYLLRTLHQMVVSSNLHGLLEMVQIRVCSILCVVQAVLTEVGREPKIRPEDPIH